MVATIIGSGSTSTISYDQTDHLSGASVVTNASGTITELSDYLPFGAVRIDEQMGSNEQRKFIGELYDVDTSLSYLNARYYDSSKGKFLSQDPIFLGDPKKQDIANPQNLNSYSYAGNNPITKSDPTGKCIWDGCITELIIAGAVLAPIISNYAANLTSPMGQILTNLAVDDIKTVQDPKASTSQKVVAGIGVLGAAFPEVKGAKQVINMSVGRLSHVFTNHTVEGLLSAGKDVLTANKSIFNASEDLPKLIQSGAQQAKILQDNNNFRRVFDVGRNIGVDQAGKPTSWMTIITNAWDELITSHPSKPTKPPVKR
jgi:RHS repeat-associated protein